MDDDGVIEDGISDEDGDVESDDSKLADAMLIAELLDRNDEPLETMIGGTIDDGVVDDVNDGPADGPIDDANDVSELLPIEGVVDDVSETALASDDDSAVTDDREGDALDASDELANDEAVVQHANPMK
jgi:hypothetical protein